MTDLNINFGFQLFYQRDDINLLYQLKVGEYNRYIKSLIDDISNIREIPDLISWYPFDYEFRADESKTILDDLYVQKDVDNIFLKEYFFLRECCRFKNQLWYIRPYLYLTDSLLSMLIESDIMNSIEFSIEEGGAQYLIF